MPRCPLCPPKKFFEAGGRTRVEIEWAARFLLTGSIVFSSLLTLAQQGLPLTTQGQIVASGWTNEIRCKRPDSLTNVRVIVPFGTVTKAFYGEATVKDGQVISASDTIFKWTMCEDSITRTWAIAEGFVAGRLVIRDTTWFAVRRASLTPRLIGPDGSDATTNQWLANEWWGIAAPSKIFWEKKPAAEVIGYEVLITQDSVEVEKFLVTGALLSSEQHEKIAAYSRGELVIQKIMFRFPCGTELMDLPGRSLLLGYAAPK